MQLAETQAAIRDAVVLDAPEHILPALIDRGDTAYRLSIHQRHYAASLVGVIRTRFPTLEWLLGSEFLNAAAQRFIQTHPPARASMAEYGSDFPGFLRTLPGTRSMPWLADIARLEWHVGTISVEIAHPPLTLSALSDFETTDLSEISLRMQPGLAHLVSGWPVDALLDLRLSGATPEHFSFEPEDVHLEVRGARGDFTVARKTPGDFVFRAALASGNALTVAIAAGETAESAFDAGAALARVFGEGLVFEITVSRTGETR